MTIKAATRPQALSSRRLPDQKLRTAREAAASTATGRSRLTILPHTSPSSWVRYRSDPSGQRLPPSRTRCLAFFSCRVRGSPFTQNRIIASTERMEKKLKGMARQKRAAALPA